MPDLQWNLQTWDRAHDWSDRGERWSGAWGGSEAQWFGCLYPRLHRFLPAQRVLEIGPGYGRWTRFLIAACDELVGVDLSLSCVRACTERFADSPRARFVVNDGLSLAEIGSGFDLIFSFDSLVHADLAVLEAYVPQMLAVLSAGGVAFIHHSNLADAGAPVRTHQRAAGVSAEAVRNLVADAGGAVLNQETVNWGTVEPIDCLTLLGRRQDYDTPADLPLENLRFMEEAAIIRGFIAPYCDPGRFKRRTPEK
jgi:SAM-dependent methyltransferase